MNNNSKQIYNYTVILEKEEQRSKFRKLLTVINLWEIEAETVFEQKSRVVGATSNAVLADGFEGKARPKS
ncbi:hypothetical protein CEP10_09075 [Cylindrospermopsis raciborskii S07]|uniref:Uncharacterized protein n=1 Tax=Cylindrospermopsis raciborskii CS-505 TaxID=533240 RepID=A0A853MCM5_9CYAN|nr:hypothetical protein [Cylindrospermopsis raciborskii]PNK03422.1 hypothetical protein CEP12_14855 [Cylindrospermopsis raciborskii S14]PNK05695.1 hypothetical protein CEP11_09240 [Cylindrospermopsis raciborskii S10]PNK07191.1 hypothetical protein CEP10_09075 [Cylindrospermopsis raciborskii S07]PNK20996.1 hypothetical protein CEP07_03895 [Cylindrospermopsis raciborskii S01]OBU77061.1 hypothetical protein A9P98_12835 [Cylindrospermopsis raciborskii CS-505]